MTRIGIYGLLGSGKTLLLTLMGFLASPNMSILTNYVTNFENSRKIHHKEIDRFEIGDCLLAISEIATMIDNRRHPSWNMDKCFYFFQSRKKRTEVRYDTQLLTIIDKRLLYITEIMIYCKKNTWKKRFEYTWKIPFQQQTFKYQIPFDIAKESIYPLYNHEEIILPVDLVHEENVKWKEIEELFKDESITKTAFVGYLKAKFPMVTEFNWRTVYDLLKGDHYKKAKEVLYSV